MQFIKTQKPASILLITIFILSGLFLVAFSVGYMTMLAVKSGDGQAQSFRAYYAAESGEEKTRYEIKTDPNFFAEHCVIVPEANIFSTSTLLNKANYSVDCLSSVAPYSFLASGNYKNVYRDLDFTYTPPPVVPSSTPSSTASTCGTYQVNVSTVAGYTCNIGAPNYDTCTYDTVQIGTQCWLKQNMNIGVMIDGVNSVLSNSTNGILEKYCYNNDYGICTSDGALYQWDEAMQASVTEGAQGICPDGWHIPTDAEQNTLDQYLKDDSATCNPNRNYPTWDCSGAGTKMQSSTGFNAIISGAAWLTYQHPPFGDRGMNAFFLSSSMGASSPWYRRVPASGPTVLRGDNTSSYNMRPVAMSVRCLKN